MKVNHTIQLPRLHKSQERVARHDARFKVLACGRRWGKTRLAALLCTKTANEGGFAWWVAPTYPMSNIGWRLMRQLARQIPGTVPREVDRMIMFPGGGWLQSKSGDNPDSLRGEGLDFVAVDECAFLTEAVWTQALRPSLSDRLGRAMFISTPKGRNWFWKLWQRGKAGESEYISWQFPTSDNPYILPTEIEAAGQSLPEEIFRQEYLAEFLEDAGAVFRNIGACLHAPETLPEDHIYRHTDQLGNEHEKAHRIVMGVDWGKQQDFTALSVVCKDCNQEVALDRFNQIDYHFQRKRLKALVDKWHVTEILAESNAMGEPVIEELQREGLPVAGFMTTATSKPPLIESLALALEREECQWLDIPVATAELEAYERKTSVTTGRNQYSAPSGMHDDTVMARALAWQMCTNANFMIGFAG